MKHYRFIANEALGYLRLMRPGSVIGPQQHFLRDMQSRMWKAGKEPLTAAKTVLENPVAKMVSSRDADHVQMEDITFDNGRDLNKLTGRAPIASLNFSNITRNKSAKGTSIERAMYELSTSSSTMSANRTRRAVRAVNELTANSRQSRSSSGAGTQGNLGILRNASYTTMDHSIGGVCTHRTINSTGQPRKLVIPVSQTGKICSRESSPVQRKSVSPLRNIRNCKNRKNCNAAENS